MAATGDDSWLDDVAVERLEMVLEQSEDDWTRLDEDNEHVSGPAATEYRRRTAGAATFLGRTVRARTSVKRLLEQSDTDIHRSEAMTCVHRAETAECREEKLLLGLPADDGPDESRCHSTCASLACTDRDIADHRMRPLVLETEARDPMTPRPHRDRAAAKAAQICAVIERHEASRPGSHARGRRSGRMTRKNRDREAERQEIRAAAERLLAGTPPRSPVGKLTGAELIAECGLRRDVVYGDHKELVDEFRARAKAQNFTPQIVQDMADENIVLREALAKIKAELAAERERVRALVRAATELSLELEQAREELAAAQQVARLPGPRETRRVPD
ncbi:hypothetical protein ACFVFH_27755 [Streptomyces sp. NPDC057697]|uniref:hypothetical protein n=1 Tax=Streptomyces sp. NPDC057697 TaxID=3346219 RepID=UPI00368D6A22